MLKSVGVSEEKGRDRSNPGRPQRLDRHTPRRLRRRSARPPRPGIAASVARPDVHDVVHRPLDRRRPPRPRRPASGPAPPRRTRSGRGRTRRRSVGPAPRPTALTPGAPLVRPVAREAARPRLLPGQAPCPMDRHQLQPQPLRRQPVRVSDDDHPVRVHHDRLPEAVGIDRGRYLGDSLAVPTGVLLVRGDLVRGVSSPPGSPSSLRAVENHPTSPPGRAVQPEPGA
jgi:hypothetical protein